MKLDIHNLWVEAEGKTIIKGLSLSVNPGEIVALMGPNGSGKTTLSNAIMGHPKYTITKGTITLDDQDITHMNPEERARKGLFLSYQHPPEIPGLEVFEYLREITKVKEGRKIGVAEFKALLNEKMRKLHIDPAFAKRYLNDGFSGGEKKRMEILQMSLLEPRLAILDETDSGLDIDALKTVAEGISSHKEMSVLVITHYKRLLDYLKPTRVIVLRDGRLSAQGGIELVDKLEEEGYVDL